MATDIAGLVFGGIFAVMFVVSCLLSVVKACKDRRKIKERIATRRAFALPYVVTTSTSAYSVDRPRSASQYGDLGAPEIFNYRRSSHGSNVIVRAIGEDGYDIYESSTKLPSTVSSNYTLNYHTDEAQVHGRRYLENPMTDDKYYQRRRSYEEAMTNPLFNSPRQTERRLTEPNPRYYRGDNGRNYSGSKKGELRPNCYEMNGRRGKENMAFDRLEETHQF